jgi:hypothetical protein
MAGDPLCGEEAVYAGFALTLDRIKASPGGNRASIAGGQCGGVATHGTFQPRLKGVWAANGIRFGNSFAVRTDRWEDCREMKWRKPLLEASERSFPSIRPDSLEKPVPFSCAVALAIIFPLNTPPIERVNTIYK